MRGWAWTDSPISGNISSPIRTNRSNDRTHHSITCNMLVIKGRQIAMSVLMRYIYTKSSL